MITLEDIKILQTNQKKNQMNYKTNQITDEVCKKTIKKSKWNNNGRILRKTQRAAADGRRPCEELPKATRSLPKQILKSFRIPVKVNWPKRSYKLILDLVQIEF